MEMKDLITFSYVLHVTRYARDSAPLFYNKALIINQKSEVKK